MVFGKKKKEEVLDTDTVQAGEKAPEAKPEKPPEVRYFESIRGLPVNDQLAEICLRLTEIVANLEELNKIAKNESS